LIKFTPRSWLKWLKYLFVTFHFLLYSTLILASAALYIAFRNDGLEIVNTYFLKPFGIHYRHSEGSLVEGFTLHDVHNSKSSAKTISLKYSLVKMLNGDHTVDSIRIDGLRIHLDDFISDDDSPWPFPTFNLKEITLTNLQLISSYPLEIDLYAKNGTYDGDNLNLASLEGTFKSRYGSGAITGKMKNTVFSGIGDLYPNANELDPYSGRFTTLPRSLRIRISHLSGEQAILSTVVNRLESKQDSSITAESINLNLTYLYQNDYLDIDAKYLLRHLSDTMQTTQHLRYDLSGTTSTEFEGVITSTRPLPSNNLHGAFTDNAEGISGTVVLDGSTLSLSSKDYNDFNWKLISQHQNLAFLPDIPDTLRSSPLNMEAFGVYHFSDNSLNAHLKVTHKHAHFDGIFSTQNNHHILDGNLTLPPDAEMWKTWSHKPPEHLSLYLENEADNTRIQISSDQLSLSGKLKKESIEGSGNYLGAFFDFGGNTKELQIDTVIPSVFATVSKIKPVELQHGEYYDAEIRAKTHLSFGSTLSVKSDISIPWYAAVLDSQRAYAGTDGNLEVSYSDGNITLNHYRLEIADHPVYSDKISHLHLTSSGELAVDELWLYDTLMLEGYISDDLSANLRLRSDRFSYRGPEGTAHAKADITFTRDAAANQNLFGSVHILDAAITNLPLQRFKVMDDDIIIIQDVRPPSNIKLAMNLHITAAQPIRFKNKELDLLLNPDITLWKDPTSPMQILGILTIPSGTAVTAGKQFDIKPSEIYFGGDVPLNPYLNLTIAHEVDYKKILIYVTHTLDSPIFLFSSDPVMSQNDIMSYILFGTPANTLSGKGDNSTSTIRADATNFMLGAGIKGLISGATKIQIDTMNILTTQEGGVGFEVGARLNKDLRVLYKNDTVSSIQLQYTLNRWLRLDADVHELGQGINAVYIKDFRDFLPHNPPKK